ncbi:MAG: hypothetical protein A2Y10_12895 [Planctomycetes bacterium GWF2_41_51]|nr:MAG: hypothetical protein A2Y10_12895 [Planctomycetes bacterium GWF2_41_51]HBG28230.1 hypothetical protein [Phycisphaerales bacterium]
MGLYKKVNEKILSKWNTWNGRSVLSHVHMPDCFSINLGFCFFGQMLTISDPVFGYKPLGVTAGCELDEKAEIFSENFIKIIPSYHAYDGSYTSLHLVNKNIEYSIETAVYDDDIVIYIEPIGKELKAPVLLVNGMFLWNMPGIVKSENGSLIGQNDNSAYNVYVNGEIADEPNMQFACPYLAVKADKPVAVSTGTKRTNEQICKIIEQQRNAELNRQKRWEALEEVHNAMQVSIAWNLIYDPKEKRPLVSPSRKWNCLRLGYATYGWDNFFSAMMIAMDSKELAMSTVLSTLKNMVEGEFVPNVANASGRVSIDRSHPPVGSLSVDYIHQLSGDDEFLKEAFEPLLKWNRWWNKKRKDQSSGMLSWGSNYFKPLIGDPAEVVQVNCMRGAALESGMDNSPMYDKAEFDKISGLSKLADVGLNSFYTADCLILAKIAATLNRDKEAHELKERTAYYIKKLEQLWCDEAGIFLNRHTDSGQNSYRLSPTLFYPMFAGVASESQTKRMITEHLCNYNEFWGDWVIPSIARNDSAYKDQSYWRGRIWGPLNLMVYFGLCNYEEEKVQKEVAVKSMELLLKNWKEFGGVYENYCANTGIGNNVKNSEPLIGLGGLFGLIALMEKFPDFRYKTNLRLYIKENVQTAK